MAKKYGVASDYIKYTSRIKSDTSDGVAVEASQVVDLEEDKLQSDINKELKASIASASGNTYSKSEIDGKDTATLTSAKSYADTKKTEAVNAAATDAATKANAALASAKSYADEKVSALGSVYTTKGSCTAAQLKALTSAKAGDVWNITDAITIDGKAYPAGVNVVCVTAFAGTIDPATTRNWDALQGLQDLTSYAKWSQVEEAAISDVEFERDVAGEDNSYTFKKTLTYVGGTKREVDFGIILDPATSTKAGVMSAADKVKLDAVDGRIQGVKIYKSSTDGFIIQNAEYDNLKATIGTDVHIESAVNIGDSTNIGAFVNIGYSANVDAGMQIRKQGNGTSLNGAYIGTQAELSDNAQIKRNVLIYEEVEIGNNATIGTDTIGTSLIQIRNNYADKIAIGNGVQITQGVGIAVDDDCNLVFGREIEGFYQMKTAATTDALSALATRVSALEDLLKLA